MNRLLLIGIVCLSLSLAGWVALILIVWLLPGGHPPLSAYVAVPVILGTIPISAIGVIAGILNFRKGSAGGPASAVVMIGNGLVLAIDVYNVTRF
jgi:hypothetical protein